MTSTQPLPDTAPVLPRPRLPSAGIAASALWMPCLVGLGVVQGSSYALSTYWKLFVAMPGVIVSILLKLDGFSFGAVAVLTTAAAYAALYLIVRRLPLITMRILIAAAAVLVGVEAFFIGALLRM